MTAWLLIASAVAANVGLNLCLKAVSRLLYFDSPLSLAGRILLSPWTWVGFICGVVLLASFALSLRSLPLSVSYTVITCAAMVSLTVIGSVWGYETLNYLRAIGLMCIVFGLALMVRSV